MEHLLEENVAAEDLKKFETRYQAELSAGLVSASAQFDYAWCLVRSKYPSDIRKGILLLEDLYTVRFLIITYLEVPPSGCHQDGGTTSNQNYIGKKMVKLWHFRD